MRYELQGLFHQEPKTKSSLCDLFHKKKNNYLVFIIYLR
jgi:hypothetical protein